MRRRELLLGLIAVATVLAGSFGVWAVLHAGSLRLSASYANSAVISRSETASVRGDITGAVQSIFTYDYSDVGRTRAAAQRLLTGTAIKEYDQLFALVERQAPAEKLMLTTKVTAAGVELLTRDRARVLVFASQKDTRAGTSQASYAGTMFAVTAIRKHSRWLIENIDTFTGSAGSAG